MDVFEAIDKRRSVRSYKSDQISDDELGEIIKAGCMAPIASARYEKVSISVIQNSELLEKMSKAVSSYFAKELKPFYNAPTLIIVSGKKYPAIGFGGQKWGQENIEIANTACIIENMSLAATSLGLGSTYITGFISAFTEEPCLLKELGLARGFHPIGGLLLGFKSKTTRKMAEEKRISINIIK